MALMLDHVDYLSKEIGARPAGTEEEQQAALYIAEQFQKEASFTAAIEEFTSSSNLEGAQAIPAVVTLVVTILAMFANFLSLPAFVLSAIAALVFTLEALGNHTLSRALSRGASQNVVAKYQPFPGASAANKRTRKVVLVAHYDTGKVTPGPVKALQNTGLPWGMITVGGMIAAAFLLLIRTISGGGAGVGALLLNVLTIVALVVVALPIVRAILYRVAPYNEGANANASGVAAIIEVARRISRGSVSEADLAAGAEEVIIHGEEAARENGLVPEGAQIRYEAEQLQPPEEIGDYDEEERLLAAKAAIAALTGKPVDRKVYGSVAGNLVNSRAQEEGQPAPEAGEALAEGQPQQEEPVPQAEPEPEPEPPVPPATIVSNDPEAAGFENAPGWFVAAQRNAKRPAGETGRVQRSRYTEAIEAVEREAAQRESERQAREAAQREAELRAREEAARAAIEAAQGGVKSADQGEAAGKLDVPSIIEVPAIEEPPAQEAGLLAADEPSVDPGSTVAHAPISVDQLRREMAEQGDDLPSTPAPAAEPAAQPANQPAAEPPRSETEAPADAQPASRSIDLPSIEGEAAPVPENTNPSRSGLFRRLRTDVPSLSGVIRMQDAGQDVSQKVQVPAIDQAEPSIEYEPPALERIPELYQDSVDYDMEVPLAGDQPAPADPEPAAQQPARVQPAESQPAPAPRPAEDVDVPETRAAGLLGRFRHKGKDRDALADTPQQWLDVDDDFDARSVGRERGGWESFRDESYDEPAEGEGSWNGGAFSRVRLGHVDTRSGEGSPAEVPDALVESPEDQELNEEIEQIYHFRNPLFNTEVWFAAIGSDTDLHDGARAFVDEHRDELRGSMIVEVESLGLGALSVVSEEGRYRPIKASSRVKRYLRQATAATGVSPDSVKLAGSDSITTVVQRAGLQAMHLVGVEDGRTALKGSADDVVENIDEMLLDENVNFLLELVKHG